MGQHPGIDKRESISGTVLLFRTFQVVQISRTVPLPDSNVYAIQFQTAGDVQNGYVGWREFDLIGTPTAVPEPTSLGLLALATLSLLPRRRRH